MLHDLDRPLNDLKEIKECMSKDIAETVKLIDTKINEYETDIEAVEQYLRTEQGRPEATINDDTIHDGEVMGVTGLDK
jgi:hypothetical protein